MVEEIPPSSDDLRKWLQVMREARTACERNYQTMVKAAKNIERLAAKALPPAKVEDAQAAG